MRFLYLKLIYSKCLKQAILLLCVSQLENSHKCCKGFTLSEHTTKGGHHGNTISKHYKILRFSKFLLQPQNASDIEFITKIVIIFPTPRSSCFQDYLWYIQSKANKKISTGLMILYQQQGLSKVVFTIVIGSHGVLFLLVDNFISWKMA